jgi:regulator of nucleoside diphosphate kinase
MARTMMMTVNDYEKISTLMEVPYAGNARAGTVRRLQLALKGAQKFPPEHIPGNIVTMNSRMWLKELASGRQTEVTVTYPAETDHRGRKVSVFSPAGMALLGCREGDIVSWQTPSGTGSFRIDKVTYQPEAAGDYHL